jgi:parvulin-like peptidyl-prolyl isomerase
MTRGIRSLALPVMLWLGATLAVAGAPQILAEVGRDTISAPEFLATLKTLRGSGELGQTLKTMTPEGHREILDQIIEMRLYAEAGRAEGLQNAPDVRDAIARATTEIVAQRYLDTKLAQSTITDDELRTFYQSHRDDFVTKDRVRARHIVVKTRLEAEDVLTRLREGADFAALAAERSLEPATKAKGGDLGWVPRGVMVKAFEDALFSLKVGDVGTVVETTFGFHVIRLDEIEPPVIPAFDVVRDAVRRQVVAERRARLKAELMSKLGVTIHREVLEGLSK